MNITSMWLVDSCTSFLLLNSSLTRAHFVPSVFENISTSLCSRVHAPSTASVATRRRGSSNAIGCTKSRLRPQLASNRGCGWGYRLWFPTVSSNGARQEWRGNSLKMSGRNRKGGGGGAARGARAGEGPKGLCEHTVTEWLSTAEMVWLLLTKAAKAKSCYCCYPSIPAKSGTMLPGNSSAHQHTEAQSYTAADRPLKENHPWNTSRCTDQMCVTWAIFCY